MIIGQENRMTIPQIDKAIERLDKLMNPGEGKKEPPARVVEEYESYKKRLTVAKNRILRYYTRAKVKFPALATKKNILTVLSFTGRNMFKAWGKGGITQSIGRGINFLKQTANAGIDFLEDNKGLIVGVGATAAVIKLSQTTLGEAVKNTLATFMETNPHFASLLNVVGVTAFILAIPTIRSKIRQKTNAATIARHELKNEVLDSTMEEPEHEIMNILEGTAKDKDGNVIKNAPDELVEQIANNPELLQRFKTIVAQLPAKDPKRAQIASIVRRAEIMNAKKRSEASNELIEQNKEYNLKTKAALYVNKKETLLANVDTMEFDDATLGLTAPTTTEKDNALKTLKAEVKSAVENQFSSIGPDKKAQLYKIFTGKDKPGADIGEPEINEMVEILLTGDLNKIVETLFGKNSKHKKITKAVNDFNDKTKVYNDELKKYNTEKETKTTQKRNEIKQEIENGTYSDLQQIKDDLKNEGWSDKQIDDAIKQAEKNLEAEKIANQASND